MTRPNDEDPSGVVARIRGQVTAVAREADAAPKRSRRLATWVLVVSLLFSVAGATVGVVVAIRTSGLESADRLRDRSLQRLEQNRRALDGLNGCLARLGERVVPGPVADADEADAWVAARSAALGRLVDRGAGCSEEGVAAPAAPNARTTPSSPDSTTSPRTSSVPPSRSSTRTPAPPTPGAAPRVVVPGAPGAAGTAGVPGAPGPAGPAAPAPASRPALIPLLPQPLLPPLL